jgi:hypothetical protein
MRPEVDTPARKLRPGCGDMCHDSCGSCRQRRSRGCDLGGRGCGAGLDSAIFDQRRSATRIIPITTEMVLKIDFAYRNCLDIQKTRVVRQKYYRHYAGYIVGFDHRREGCSHLVRYEDGDLLPSPLARLIPIKTIMLSCRTALLLQHAHRSTGMCCLQV